MFYLIRKYTRIITRRHTTSAAVTGPTMAPTFTPELRISNGIN